MGDRTAIHKFGATAEKWRALAETRREYFRELYRTGRWRLYYNEEEFVARLRDIARICDRWQLIIEGAQAVVQPAPAPQEAAIERRDAA